MDAAKGNEIRQARRVVVLETPYRQDGGQYALECLRHSLTVMGEAPLAGHLLYTQVLDDKAPDQRELGILVGLTMHYRADAIIFYADCGMTEGMLMGLERAVELKKPIEVRYIRTLDAISSMPSMGPPNIFPIFQGLSK